MKLVLDSNSLFSIMKPSSVSAYLFKSMRYEFIAPEFIREELKKHKKECLTKSKLSEHEFEIWQREVEVMIKFIKLSEYEDLLEKAKRLISDPDDIDFLALAISTNSTIWSNDPHFKEQSLVPVLTTGELVRKFFRGEV